MALTVWRFTRVVAHSTLALWLGVFVPLLCVPGVSSDHSHGIHWAWEEGAADHTHSAAGSANETPPTPVGHAHAHEVGHSHSHDHPHTHSHSPPTAPIAEAEPGALPPYRHAPSPSFEVSSTLAATVYKAFTPLSALAQAVVTQTPTLPASVFIGCLTLILPLFHRRLMVTTISLPPPWNPPKG